MPKLIITIINAENIKKTQLIGRQDPFVEIRSDMQRRYTQTHDNGDQNPLWNEEKEIDCKDLNGTLIFSIMNKNFIKNTLIGESVFHLSQLISCGGFCDIRLPVMTANREQGFLHVVIRDTACPIPTQPGLNIPQFVQPGIPPQVYPQPGAPYPPQADAYPVQAGVVYPQEPSQSSPYPIQAGAPYPQPEAAEYPPAVSPSQPIQAGTPYPAQPGAPYPQDPSQPIQAGAPYPAQPGAPYPPEQPAAFPTIPQFVPYSQPGYPAYPPSN